MTFARLLQKNSWAIPLALVSMGAFFEIDGVSALVGATLALGPKERAMAPVGRPASAEPAEFHSRSAESILARNPFDSVTGPLVAQGAAIEEEAPPNEVDGVDPRNAPPCDGVRVLAIAASEDADWSFAAMSVAGSAEAVLRRRGGNLGSKEVAYVGWDRVWLWTGSSASGAGGAGAQGLCQADIDAPPVTPPRVAAPPDAGAAGGLDPSMAERIQRLGPTEFNVDRSVVARVFENQAAFVKGVRIFPEQQGGKTVGIRLAGIRPDSLLGAVGLVEGDRLQTINGFDISSPEKALEVYARLPTWDNLTVVVNRKGQDTNIDLHLK
jgi:general secretion pathway protein C